MPRRSDLIRRMIVAGRARIPVCNATAERGARRRRPAAAAGGATETVVEGLQDSVHRESQRTDQRFGELMHAVAPRGAGAHARRRVAAPGHRMTATEQPIDFFVPAAGPNAADSETAYAAICRRAAADSGIEPRQRRIFRLWSRREGRDCVTEVGRPDPIHGLTVLAILDLGRREPFVIHCGDPDDVDAAVRDHVGCHVYAVTDFATGGRPEPKPALPFGRDGPALRLALLRPRPLARLAARAGAAGAARVPAVVRLHPHERAAVAQLARDVVAGQRQNRQRRPHPPPRVGDLAAADLRLRRLRDRVQASLDADHRDRLRRRRRADARRVRALAPPRGRLLGEGGPHLARRGDPRGRLRDDRRDGRPPGRPRRRRRHASPRSARWCCWCCCRGSAS